MYPSHAEMDVDKHRSSLCFCTRKKNNMYVFFKGMNKTTIYRGVKNNQTLARHLARIILKRNTLCFPSLVVCTENAGCTAPASRTIINVKKCVPQLRYKRVQGPPASIGPIGPSGEADEVTNAKAAVASVPAHDGRGDLCQQETSLHCVMCSSSTRDPLQYGIRTEAWCKCR